MVTDGDGAEHKFIITKMPAWDGLDIMERLPASFIAGTLPKLGDRKTIWELKNDILKYVAVDLNGQKQPLVTQALIDNHCGDWECLFKLLQAEVEYNNRFFRNGTISNFLSDFTRTYLAKISAILKESSELSSPTNKQPSMNSEPSTP